jgi:integrase
MVHPNHIPATTTVIPMSENLEFSFADAIAAVERASDLPRSKRTHWSCSLRQIAKALNRPPESLAARWLAVAHRVNGLHHAGNGVEWKTLANHKSNAKAALFWFRREQGLPLRGTPLHPQWQVLRRQLSDRSRLAKLSGLIRYCNLKDIAPTAVDETVIDDYMRYRAETTALAVDTKARRAIARAWNASAVLIEGWPQRRLAEPPLKLPAWPRWQDFPQQLQSEVESYLTSLTKPRRSATRNRLRPCKLSTIRTRRTELISFAKKTVRRGVPIENLSSLARLLDPVIVERVLNDEWEKNGDEPKTSTIDLAKKLVVIARALGCLDAAACERLDDMRANLEQYRQEGLTPKNLNLIRQVLNDEVWARVVNCPTDLMRRARALKKQAPVKAAVVAQIAVGIAILTVAPIRASNLAAINLDENLIKPGGSQSPYLLVFPHYDVKNRVNLSFELDDHVTELIDEYVHEYRPAVVRGSNETWLFPGSAGGSKDAHLFGIQISERIYQATGLRMTIHQFRHAAAAIYLKHHPGHYETVRQFLGHRNIETTKRFYCGLETIDATRLFGDLVRKHLRFEPDVERRPKKKNRKKRDR